VIDPENTALLRLARDRYAAQEQQARHRGSKRAPASHASLPARLGPCLILAVACSRSAPAACCARAASGHAAAAPPSANMNSRRRMWIAMRTPPSGGRVHAIEGTISRFSEGTNKAFCAAKVWSPMSQLGQSRESRGTLLYDSSSPQADFDVLGDYVG
jgi:hypothetical protein